ncbi:hypothetical protein [Streptomyces sp. NPDC088801]|uniref:hypothetical protein n=1 Tax=Streptomyces sp. NPDC088801 TaxID=3365903 RepID=UPI0037F6256E
MRNIVRIGFVLASFFIFWTFKNTTFGQSSFVVAVVALIVEQWVTSQLTQRSPSRQAARVGAADSGEPSASTQKSGGVGEVLTILMAFLAVSVMADAFFFTTWLDLPKTADSASGMAAVAVAIKIIASVLAIGVAFISPAVVGFGAWGECAEWLDARSNAQGGGIGGCVSIVPGVIVGAACYGHFYVAYLFYESLGVLRPH